MKKLFAVIVLEKIFEKIIQNILTKKTLDKASLHLASADRAGILFKIIKYVKYAAILIFSSSIILVISVIFGLYYLFTHFN